MLCKATRRIGAAPPCPLGAPISFQSGLVTQGSLHRRNGPRYPSARRNPPPPSAEADAVTGWATAIAVSRDPVAMGRTSRAWRAGRAWARPLTISLGITDLPHCTPGGVDLEDRTKCAPLYRLRQELSYGVGSPETRRPGCGAVPGCHLTLQVYGTTPRLPSLLPRWLSWQAASPWPRAGVSCVLSVRPQCTNGCSHCGSP